MEDSSQVPSTSNDMKDPICPKCGRPLTNPREGQHFTAIEIPTMEPSKVCERCKVGYWLAQPGWIVVATLHYI